MEWKSAAASRPTPPTKPIIIAVSGSAEHENEILQAGADAFMAQTHRHGKTPHRSQTTPPRLVSLFLSVTYCRVYAPVAQLDRVSDYESEGQRFESSRAYRKQNGNAAQKAQEVRLFVPFVLLVFRPYSSIRPPRSPRVTASVRDWRPAFPESNRMWNLMVCSEMLSRMAISLLPRPSARSCRTSASRGVSASTGESSSDDCGARTPSKTVRPAATERIGLNDLLR